jgi:hypothetical protein
MLPEHPEAIQQPGGATRAYAPVLDLVNGPQISFHPDLKV